MCLYMYKLCYILDMLMCMYAIRTENFEDETSDWYLLGHL